jgi:hypothetical protein
MKTVKAPKRNDGKSVMIITIDASRVSRGHTAHRSGAGTHTNKGTKRLRTRSAQHRFALKD